MCRALGTGEGMVSTELKEASGAGGRRLSVSDGWAEDADRPQPTASGAALILRSKMKLRNVLGRGAGDINHTRILQRSYSSGWRMD